MGAKELNNLVLMLVMDTGIDVVHMVEYTDHGKSETDNERSIL